MNKIQDIYVCGTSIFRILNDTERKELKEFISNLDIEVVTA